MKLFPQLVTVCKIFAPFPDSFDTTENHRIIELLRLEETNRIIQFNHSPITHHHSLNHVPQHHIQIFFEHLQGCCNHNLSGQPAPAPHRLVWILFPTCFGSCNNYFEAYCFYSHTPKAFLLLYTTYLYLFLTAILTIIFIGSLQLKTALGPPALLTIDVVIPGKPHLLIFLHLAIVPQLKNVENISFGNTNSLCLLSAN